ncbi:class I SAM-dependent methyltransferase [Pseudoduganella plicata]|uniref:class I SAM-dependent methyltransferase n=1 Tax=Pseudoduganella plicata TaxID=321984 RepID=UPI001E5999DB
MGSKAAQRGFQVRQGYFPDALRPDETFDVIVFNDVIEHIPDIGSALRACHEHLNPGGILILNLPNSRGFFLPAVQAAGPAAHRRAIRKDVAEKPALAASALLRQREPYPAPGRRRLLAGLAARTARAARAGLKERLGYVGNPNPLVLWGQYVVIRSLIPVLRLFPSDIIVGIYRREE